ncbi:MAG: hypothetical protein ACRD4S_16915 [Candidatus Acidiferrales bacterium]
MTTGPLTPDSVPTHFPAGTTVKYTRNLDGFAPADGWLYTLYMNGLLAAFNKQGVTQDDATFLVTLLASDTAALAPGAYRYAERLTNSGTGEVYDITGDELVITIEPNIAVATPGTFQTFEEKTLVVLEAAIAGRLTTDIQSYQIAGRAVNKIPVEELMQLRGKYRAMVWRQQNPGRLGVPYKVIFKTEGDEANFPPTWQDVTGLDRG